MRRSAAASRPVLVTRAETALAEKVSSPKPLAHIDWFAFTFSAPAEFLDQDEERRLTRQGRIWLARELERMFRIDAGQWLVTDRGYNGYKVRCLLGQGGAFGLVAYGGKHQRGTVHVSLSGTACARVRSWPDIQAWGESMGARIARVDLAHDDYEGRTVNIEQVQRWYEEGGFTCGGRPPARKYIESDSGRTLYFGNGGHGKLFRGYEKGKEQGDLKSPWFRAEIQLRNKDRVIPWDVLTRPGDYLAGAYPALAFLSEVQDKIKTCAKLAAMTLDRATEYARLACGRIVNVLLQVHGGDYIEVLDLIRRDGTPRRLVGLNDYLLPSVSAPS